MKFSPQDRKGITYHYYLQNINTTKAILSKVKFFGKEDFIHETEERKE
jgi:hypothetical protein